MSDDRRKILEMLASGRLTADEADRLLSALDRRAAEPATGARPNPPKHSSTPKYLRVQVSKLRGDGDDAKKAIRSLMSTSDITSPIAWFTRPWLLIRNWALSIGSDRSDYAQCPMPNAQCPMPNAQCLMPNA